ncbi:alcohol dehydrogenase catalytic domain-containing protein [Kitasatospora sp. MAP5-34]|uniref:alcohol dehydrogenase catalytic domain-containing protein n=1 Tax=Kitasatospora sp. MAP5-34 TaxID=3035102 RepID=UPI002474161B|nr:alcohol dehydrogenase catalytic domain-containing protein [Kitasatospora sp. MAP5-34]MDH6579142.1 threonine dehydrogenase-like Zn-dependent dehydrogenase [Kitasatospora sp. MAP5-34]
MRVVLGVDGPSLERTPCERPPGEHAVRVRIEVAGLCRSDLKEIVGDRHGVSQFGHELVGVVEESTLPGLSAGQRVSLDPNVAVTRGTGFATRMWAAGPADCLAAALPVVPHGVAARRLVFTEPLACARHCLAAIARHLGTELPGLRLGVLGAGTAGVLIAGLADALGADVALGNRSADRTSFLRDSGVLDVPIGPMESLPEGGLDVAVVATTLVQPAVLEQALRLVAPGGLVMLYGGTAPGDTLAGLDCDLDTTRRTEVAVSTSWQGKAVRVGGSYGTAPADFVAAVDALTGRPFEDLPVERLITREIRLADLPGVLRDQVTGRPLGKTLIRP